MAGSSSVSALPEKSESEKEEMLDRMLTRLALCEDSNLQNLLSKLLPLSISFLSSTSTPVRNKVLEILSHVNKRVKHQLDIGLPLSELWNLYIEPNAAPMVRNFCIVYIEMAFERVQIEVKEDMVPLIVANISKLPTQHQEIILRISAKVIGDCHCTHLRDEIAGKYRLIKGSEDSEIFLEFCLHTMLYQSPSQGGGSPAGLSISQSNRVSGKQLLTSDILSKRKLGILNVVEAMELVPEIVYPLFLVACVDCHEPVIKRGEELLKKKASGVNLEDQSLINRLYLLFNGTAGAQHISQDNKVTPGSLALRARLMSVFCRSITAANSFPATLQCIFSCIYGNDTSSRLKQLGMEFTVWVFKHAKEAQLKLMGPVILNGILKSLDGYSTSESDTIARETKTFAFQAIGLLAQRMPNLFRDKIDMAVRLFDALKSETQFLRLTIQEATSSLAVAYKGADKKVLENLELLLLKSSQVEQSEVRFCAVRWATSLFDLDHCPSRYICMLGAADMKMDIREMALEGLILGKDQQRTISENPTLKYPNVGDMLDYIVKQQPALLESTEMRGSALLFPSKTYVVMIQFLLKCFNAGLDESNALDKMPNDRIPLENMFLLLEHAMAYEGSAELHASASKAMIDVGAHFPEMVASRYALRIVWLKQLLGHVDFDTRESIARLLGISSCALPLSALSDLIAELISSLSGSKLRFEIQHGVLCALGYVTANCMSRSPTISESLLQSALTCLVDIVNSETSTLASIAMQALGHIGLGVPLPQLHRDSSSAPILTVLKD